jgi:hypothetical protein
MRMLSIFETVLGRIEVCISAGDREFSFHGEQAARDHKHRRSSTLFKGEQKDGESEVIQRVQAPKTQVEYTASIPSWACRRPEYRGRAEQATSRVILARSHSRQDNKTPQRDCCVGPTDPWKR